MIVCNLFLDFDYDGISDRVGIIFSCFFDFSLMNCIF